MIVILFDLFASKFKAVAGQLFTVTVVGADVAEQPFVVTVTL